MKDIISKITCVFSDAIAHIFMDGKKFATIEVVDGLYMANGKGFDRIERATAEIVASRIAQDVLAADVPGINMLQVDESTYFFSRNNVMFQVFRKGNLWHHQHNIGGFETPYAAAADRAKNL